MSDELNPYPGNLKHHRVEPMKWRPVLFTDAALDLHEIFDARHMRDEYEAARAKDAELIQRLVDGLKHAQRFAEEYGYGPLQTVEWDLDAAAAAGFKPSIE